MKHTISYLWVSDDRQLAEICEQANQAEAVALDTEFIRTRSFYPKLGLIQLFDGKQVSLIDPTEISDFSPFIRLLANENVIKVLHACSEDLEVFECRFNQLPTPLVDTQVIANFLNLDSSIGFAKLVAHYLDIELDKGASRTDWLARPLSETQLQYAAADVYYLLPIYQQMQPALLATSWAEAVKEECQFLLDKRKHTEDPNKAYQHIANAWRLEPPQLAVLQMLAKWRLEEAQKRDLALNFVVKEAALYEIARMQPKHTSQLLEFMHPNEVRIHGKKILRLVEQGVATLPEGYPSKITRLVDQKGYKYALQAMQQKLAEIRPLDLPLELLASKRQLNQLFKWHCEGENQADKQPELLSGWRQEYGKKLLHVLRGKYGA